MPVGEVLVGHVIEPDRIFRILDVQQDAVSRARARGEADLGEHGDVVALIGFRRLLCSLAVRAAAPEPGDVAGRGIRENPRAIDDVRVLRRGERHLDDVDAEQRRIRIFLRLEAGAAGELLRRPHGARARAVDVQVRRIMWIRDERVRMRSAARLHGRNLSRLAQVADVEDADAAKPLAADRRLHALRAAIEPAARLLDRHEEPWPPGQTTEASSFGRFGRSTS